MTDSNISPQSPPNSPAATAPPTIRELSKESQSRWIERLFARFSAMYGQQFLAMWAQADLSEVKALWAEKLGGFTADHLAAALKACDEKRYPPNLPEFIALCRDQARRDGTGVLRLVAPGPDGATRAARREQTRKMIERLARKMGHED